MTLAHPSWPPISRVVLWLLLLAGVSLRLAFFAQDRPVWVDEAGLALNVIDQPWRTLVGPLDATFQTNPRPFSLKEVGMSARQTTPLVCLAMLKMAADAGHGDPRILRVPALMASLFWLGGLAWWARRRPWVEGLAIFAAVAFSRSVIEYSTEIKQYGWEAAVAGGLQILFMANSRPELWTKRRTAGMALAGALAVWCAFGSVLVLAGNGLVLAFRAIQKKDRDSLVRLAVVGATWVTSFAIYYFSLLRDNFALQSASYQHAFPALGLSILRWTRDAVLGLVENPGGFDFRWAALGLFTAALGAISLWKRDRTEACLVLSPIAVTLTMAIAHRYPWSFQLILFLSFCLSVLLGAGVAALAEQADRLQKHASVIPIAFFVLAWVPSAIAPLHAVRSHEGFKYAEVNSLLSSIQTGSTPNRIFLTHAEALVCRYYQKVSPRSWGEVAISTVTDVISGPQDVAATAQEISAFSKGGDCWVVLNEVNWPSLQVELLTRLISPLTVTERRLSGGSIGLKISTSPPSSSSSPPSPPAITLTDRRVGTGRYSSARRLPVIPLTRPLMSRWI